VKPPSTCRLSTSTAAILYWIRELWACWFSVGKGS